MVLTPRRRAAALLMVLAVFPACAVDRPLVERLEQGTWRPAPAFSVESMGGQRAGATITFVLRLAEPGGRRLVVEGTVEIDPGATLIEGRWSEFGATGETVLGGSVASDGIDFFGGQGGRPSLGGQFVLNLPSAAQYRINLPATRLSAEGWSAAASGDVRLARVVLSNEEERRARFRS